MNNEQLIFFSIACLSLLIWLILLGFWGQFWRADRRLETEVTKREIYPSVCVVIPARNEAKLLPITLQSILTQNYAGSLSVILVDDRSTDETVAIAKNLAQQIKNSQNIQIKIILTEALPPGWTGKLWALDTGIRYGQKQSPDYFLFTDADIQHDSLNLSQLVAQAEEKNLDLVSLMVLLHCQSFWEKLLVPAFVFFFQKLYPFAWVNQIDRSTAAAAGGCILIRDRTLKEIGGIQALRQALIDDCALAKAVKQNGGHIWLGLTETTRSLRSYPSLASFWQTITRTAYTQLQYSPFLLMVTLIGMGIVYFIPPLGLIWGLSIDNLAITSIGLSTWLLMSFAYLPTLRLYQLSPMLAFCLPLIALIYTLMTLDSAVRHWQGRGGAWKGRVYPQIKF